MIDLRRITRTFPAQERKSPPLPVLSDITLRIPPGQYAAMVGASGSGKSTLMNILGCLDRPTSGVYRLHGRDVSALPPDELAKVRGEEIRLDHRPSQLSGGQQQRVAIARALIRRPALILADEPTGSLDPDATQEILSLLEDLHRAGQTILLITHNPTVAARAERRLTLQSGKIFEEG